MTTHLKPDNPAQKHAEWWQTSIIDIRPNVIQIRGYPIQELIGHLSFAQMIWLMVRGELPSPATTRLLDAALVAAVDHGPQAPSIAIARMASTCGIDINGAMASAVNALGDVHGGAGQQCMELYSRVAQRLANGDEMQQAVDSEIGAMLAQGSPIPGFGHRFHSVDPRSVRLLRLVGEARLAGDVEGNYLAIGEAIEASLEKIKSRRLTMNIDGATAVIFAELGLPPQLGRALFVLSRSVGILSHAWEQSCQGGRIKGPMPPSAGYTYTGPALRHVDGAAL